MVDSWFPKRLRESGRKERAEGRAEGRREGQREGRREAEARARRDQRATLVRLARRKFGGETAKELAALLDGVSGSDRLAEVADLIIDCSSGPELLARTAETTAPSTAFGRFPFRARRDGVRFINMLNNGAINT